MIISYDMLTVNSAKYRVKMVSEMFDLVSVFFQTLEETRKYTDSSGREEVTVTQTQPDSGSFIQPGGY